MTSPSYTGQWFIPMTDTAKRWFDGTVPNNGLLIKETNTTVNMLQFASSEHTTAGYKPSLTVNWHERLGFEPQYTYVAERSGARVEASVNVGNGNLVTKLAGPALPGVDVSHYYNSLGGADRWSSDAGLDAMIGGSRAGRGLRRRDRRRPQLRLGPGDADVHQARGAPPNYVNGNVVFDDGTTHTFIAGSSYQRDTKRLPTGQTVYHDFEYHQLGEDYWGPLDAIRDASGRRSEVTSSTSRIEDLTDPDGRRYDWVWSGDALQEQIVPDGTRDRFVYGAPNNQLVRILPRTVGSQARLRHVEPRDVR